jgi:DNA-directed RNA polymerase subunit RPC12/RpoP
VATVNFKCPNCGAGLPFDPELQKSKCTFCLSEFTIEQLDAYNRKLQEQDKPATNPAEQPAADGQADSDHLVGYVCNSCGAEVVTEETTSATFCYYCHNPVLLTERLSGAFKPQKLVPFAIDKAKAIALLQAWAGKKRYVPADFTRTSQLEKTTGLYLPHWMADYQALVDYAGKGTNLRVWIAGNLEYTEHKEFLIQRHGLIDVKHVHEVAMRKIDKSLIDSITPYDETKAVDFSLAYLSGFFAEKYDILQPDIQPVIEQRVRQYAATMVQDTITAYNRVSMERSNIALSPKAWHYALLPAWILTYRYLGKTFVYAVNGQTGKIFGELPVDQKKLGLTALIVAAVILLLFLLGGLFLW